MRRGAASVREGVVRPADYSALPRLTPEPLTQPRARPKALSPETSAALGAGAPEKTDPGR